MLRSKASLREGARRVVLLIVVCTAAVLALPALAMGALLWWSASRTWDYRERWRGIWLLAISGGLAYFLLLRYVHPLPVPPSLPMFLARSPGLAWQRLNLLWAENTLLTPGVALILEVLNPLTRRFHHLPRQWQKGFQLARGEDGVQVVPIEQGAGAPAFASSALLEPLGTYLGGDLYEWVFANQLCFPRDAMRRHGVIIGEPGYGKTITLLRLATIAVQNDMQVIFLDLKGSRKTAAQFAAAMRLVGVERIKTYPEEAYDGWRGDATALYNRLMAMIEPGTHPYYYRLTSSLVWLAVQAPAGPPHSSRDFLQRLEIGTRKQPGWLMRAYADPRYWYEMRKVEKLRPHIHNLSLVYDGFFDGVAGGLDGTFAFEDADAVFIGLDGDILKEQAAAMGRYLLQDAAHYAKQRKSPERHVLMVIDEFGVLKTSNATDLYERLREAGMSMWSAAQSYQALGAERESILAAAAVKILHRCGNPEELVKFAGQRESAAFSQITDDGDGEGENLSATGHVRLLKHRTAVRMQRHYGVPLEDVQQLAIGRAVVISGGLYGWVQVYPLALSSERPSLRKEPASVPPTSQAPAPAEDGSGEQLACSRREPQREPAQPGDDPQENIGPVDFFS